MIIYTWLTHVSLHIGLRSRYPTATAYDGSWEPPSPQFIRRCTVYIYIPWTEPNLRTLIFGTLAHACSPHSLFLIRVRVLESEFSRLGTSEKTTSGAYGALKFGSLAENGISNHRTDCYVERVRESNIRNADVKPWDGCKFEIEWYVVEVDSRSSSVKLKVGNWLISRFAER